jgi:protein-S-isoprenylcysteine O-methyltransferase Ste14
MFRFRRAKTTIDFAVNHRVRITVAVVGALILQNFLQGNFPGHIASLSDLWGKMAAGLILAGLGVRSWAAGNLRKGQALTTWGPYRLCRHPLYLGSLLIMAGFGLLVQDGASACELFGPVIIVYGLTMQREEQRLARKYGAAWESYAARTPILLPRPSSFRLCGAWSAAQWLRSREHRAALAALLALATLQWWHAP